MAGGGKPPADEFNAADVTAYGVQLFIGSTYPVPSTVRFLIDSVTLTVWWRRGDATLMAEAAERGADRIARA